MQDAYTTIWIYDDVQELVQVTSAFLTDQYPNGDYVATSTDIIDLETATAAFFADRYDGECFCLDDAGHGLPLPGEQFLLPASAAVSLAWVEPSTAEDMVDWVDEYLHEHLHEQMLYEDTPQEFLLDAASETADSSGEYTSFDNVLGPNLLPKTPLLGSQRATSQSLEWISVALEDAFKLPVEVDTLLAICNDFHSDDSDDGMEANESVDLSNIAFDAAGVLNQSWASNAACFFDCVTNATVPYASLDSLLEMGQYGIQTINHDSLVIDTNFSTIVEDDLPSSAASDSPISFANHRGFLKPLLQRRQDFLDEDTSTTELLPSLHGEEVSEALNELFADDIWHNKPDLELACPGKLPNEGETVLLEVLVAVRESIDRIFELMAQRGIPAPPF